MLALSWVRSDHLQPEAHPPVRHALASFVATDALLLEDRALCRSHSSSLYRCRAEIVRQAVIRRVRFHRLPRRDSRPPMRIVECLQATKPGGFA